MHKPILVTPLLILVLPLSACGIGAETIPSVTEVTFAITSTRQPTGTPLPALGGPGIGGYSLFPLKISQISAGPDPATGRLMNVRVQIISTRDEPDTTIRIQTFSDRLKLEGEPQSGMDLSSGTNPRFLTSPSVSSTPVSMSSISPHSHGSVLAAHTAIYKPFTWTALWTPATYSRGGNGTPPSRPIWGPSCPPPS